MLETQEEVIELLKEIAQEIGITSGQVNVSQQLPDFTGEVSSSAPTVHSVSPKWSVGIKFSFNEELRVREFVIATSDFQNLDQVKTFISQELQR